MNFDYLYNFIYNCLGLLSSFGSLIVELCNTTLRIPMGLVGDLELPILAFMFGGGFITLVLARIALAIIRG